MKIVPDKNLFIRFAFVSLPFFPNLINAQQASDHRSGFTPIIQNNNIYIIGGDTTSAQIPILNIENGIDVNNPAWFERNATSANAAGLSGFIDGVAFQDNKNRVFVEAGNAPNTILQELHLYLPDIDGWTGVTQFQQQSNKPQARFGMSATFNPSDNTVYYYGGQPVDKTQPPLNIFSAFDTSSNTWISLTPSSPNVHRPGRVYHSSNIVNNQLFIMGGMTYGANTTSPAAIQADFESVLVYDIKSKTAASIATLGDIPPMRQRFSTALGLDGRSIIAYGGYSYNVAADNTSTFDFNNPTNEVYVLDTCTLTWTKKSVGGSGPKSLYGHSTVNINDYMVVMMGMTDEANFNERLYILDLKNWKWVNSFTSTSNSIAGGSCQFEMPSMNSSNFDAFNYDLGVLENPLKPKPKSDSNKSKGFGIGFGILAVIVISGAGFYLYRRRANKNNKRSLNPRWMRNVPTHTNNNGGEAFGDDRDYPLFVYNKELDLENPNNPNVQQPIRTYTSSDHEQWEQQLNQDNGSQQRHDDIWNRMRGLNHQDNNNNNNNNNNKLLDV